jgi:hypothetical protein
VTAAATVATRIPREAAGLAGLAWSYLAALTRGTGGVAEAAAILPAFRAAFADNRSAVVDAAVAIGYPRAEAEADVPSGSPSGGYSQNDGVMIAFALWPYLEISRAAGETGWGSTDELYDRFEVIPNENGTLRTWFLDNLARVWPQGTSNAHGRVLWWFASSIRDAHTADAMFSQFVFQGRDEPEPLAAGGTSIQDAAAAIRGSEASPIALPGVTITARPTWMRSALWYWVGVAILGSVGVSALYLFWYNRKYGKLPWQRGKR